MSHFAQSEVYFILSGASENKLMSMNSTLAAYLSCTYLNEYVSILPRQKKF